MRASQLFIPTLREAPADAEFISHRLLLRGGFVRKLAAGVYSYLPLGWRVHQKIAAIVRQEMNAVGGQEVFMPALVPREHLEETGRAGVDVLFTLQDRNRRDFFLGFTHEEVITDIVRGEVRSWKQLPLILYQIQTKFRDEPRPRGGLIRGREFTMKDSYSFDYEEEGLDRSYRAHYRAYERIFTRCGLPYLAVDADPGSIGGSENREFMLLTENGEDTVLRCDSCGYAANAERAEIGLPDGWDALPLPIGEPRSRVVSTPGMHTVTQVCDFLQVTADRLIKTIIVTADGEPLAALVRGDRELNLSKLRRFLGVESVEMASAATVERVTGAAVGFAGPVNLAGVPILADRELRGAVEMVVGANQDDAHRVGVTPGADFQVSDWADIRVAQAGDLCAYCGSGGTYAEARGIEVGHVFKLGVKYSQAMGAQVDLPDGERRDILMGCYGLGISRTMAAAVETHHDADGMVLPVTLAPFEATLILVNAQDEAHREQTDRLYAALEAQGVETLYDDRQERSGVKFKDADLIGCPVRIVAGRALAEGRIEISLRRDRSSAQTVPLEEAAAFVARLIAEEKARLTPKS
jgi:prolyl-tRNA synthetase